MATPSQAHSSHVEKGNAYQLFSKWALDEHGSYPMERRAVKDRPDILIFIANLLASRVQPTFVAVCNPRLYCRPGALTGRL